MNCILCFAPGADSSGRCWDCVQKAARQLELEQNDKRSMWKIRDIEEHQHDQTKH